MTQTMIAIEFNMWMSLLALARENVIKPENLKYATIKPENILPEFPRDLTKPQKPSIIIQKVYADLSDICFGKGFLGQTWSDDEQAYVDVSSKNYKIEFQYDVFADTNRQNALITSMIVDNFLFNREFTLYDYTGNEIDNPPAIGIAQLLGDISTVGLNSNENKDYRTAIRFYLNVVQTIIPYQDLIDLTKWIKVTQHVKLPNH